MEVPRAQRQTMSKCEPNAADIAATSLATSSYQLMRYLIGGFFFGSQSPLQRLVTILKYKIKVIYKPFRTYTCNQKKIYLF